MLHRTNQRCFRTNVRISGSIAVFLSLFVLCVGLSAQERQPSRGFTAGNSYAISQIEQVNTTNGNLMVNLPLAALPAGRGGSPGASLNLQYNSKLWDSVGKKAVDGTPDEHGFTKYFYDELTASDTGGWSYNLKYTLELVSRLNLEPPPVCSASDEYNKQVYIWKVRLRSPDGGVHEMVPVGGEDHFGDGYYKLGPNGEVRTASVSTVGPGEYSCSLGSYTNTTGGMVYYSTDGSFIRLKIDYISGHDGMAAMANPWTLYFPDGRRVVNSADPETDGYFQRMYDRLEHYTDVKGVTYKGMGGTAIEDELGRAIMLLQDGSDINKQYVVVHGVAGEDVTTTITWKTVWVNRIYDARVPGTFNAPYGISHHSAFSQWNMVDQITLPDQAGGQSYTFGYNGVDTIPDEEVITTGWGELNAITLPTGASVVYHYVLDDTDTWQTTEIMNNTLAEKVLTYDREYDGSATSITETWTYSLPSGGVSGISFVTGPDGGVTREDLEFGYVYKTTMPNGTVVERIWASNTPEDRAYSSRVNAYVKTEFTSIPNAAGTLTWTAIKDFTYDKNGNVTQTKEYDWVAYGDVPRMSGRPTGIPSSAAAKLKRIINNSYNAGTPAASADPDEDTDIYIYTASPKLKGVLLSSEITNASNVVAARTEFTYDDPDETGNLTQQLIWDSTRGSVSVPLVPGSSGNAIAIAHTYDSEGNVLTTTDAKGFVTQFTYGDISGPDVTVSGLYLTQTISAYGTGLARTATTVYDFYTGLVTTVTDEDNDVSMVTTYDDLGRPTLVRAAAGTSAETQTATEYHDIDRFVVSRSDGAVVGDGKLVIIQHFDQLGRIRLARVLENATTEEAAEEQDGIKVQTRYGFVNSGSDHYSYQLTSNPYRAATSSGASGEATMGWTRSTSLANDKRSEVATFSGSSLPGPVGSNSGSTGVIVTLLDANKSYVRDQAGKWRMSETSALGQLVRITEDPTSSLSGYTHTGTDLLTEYSYDTLSNLTGVSMAYSGGTQPRSFTYSSLSRLLSATNPESGTIDYEYDADGNLTERTDARSVVTTYTYDALNRLTSRNYSDGTPTVTYTYDSGSVPFGKGRLASVSNSVSTTAYTAYDPTGKLLSSTQTTDGLSVCSGSSAACVMSYKYNLAGQLTQETYPSGRIVHHNYASDGKLAAVSSRLAVNKAAKSYAQNFSYNAAGAVTGVQLGNMRWESTVFNSRLQPTQLALGTTQTGTSASDLLKLQYAYDDGTHPEQNNGHVVSQTIKVEDIGMTAGFQAVQTYTYDELNRLKSATENNTPNGGSSSQSWKQTYSYDRFGNRRFDISSGATTTIPGGCSTAECNPNFDLANNRFTENQGYHYDAAGNVTEDATGKKFVYDAENKQKSFGTGGDDDNGGTYVYDGQGLRVKKVAGGETVIFVYDAGGMLVAEYSTNVVSNPATNYPTLDILGSPRINTDGDGGIVARHDYSPFGEQIGNIGSRSNSNWYGSDNLRQTFTGYENDSESEQHFAQARYYSSKHGRFFSVDPLMASASPLEPQSWNRYEYCLNSPLDLVDPTGQKWISLDDWNFRWVDDDKYNPDDWPGYHEVTPGTVVYFGIGWGYIGSDYAKLLGGYVSLNADGTLSPAADPNNYDDDGADAPAELPVAGFVGTLPILTGASAAEAGAAAGSVTLGEVAIPAAMAPLLIGEFFNVLMHPRAASPFAPGRGPHGERYTSCTAGNQAYPMQAPPGTFSVRPRIEPTTPVLPFPPLAMPRSGWTCLAAGHLTPIGQPNVPGEIVTALGRGPNQPAAARQALDNVQAASRAGFYVRHPHIKWCTR